MNIKGNIKYIVTGSVIFLAIYMFVAAIPIGPDVSFTPVWTPRYLDRPRTSGFGRGRQKRRDPRVP